MTTDNSGLVQARVLALLPLIVFLAIFFRQWYLPFCDWNRVCVLSNESACCSHSAIILAVLIYRGELNQGIETFLRGASHPNLILMFMVFMLAGAFASTTSAIGSVDATVQMGLSAIPPAFVLPMLFIISAFIATAMGTSMGTIAACAPIAFGFSQATDIAAVYAIGAVVGGAMFGDNLQ
jgi:Na+/H+ antiporter NhaC